MTATKVDEVPPLARLDILALAAEATNRMVRLLRELDEPDWRLPTDCSAWDVRAIAGHVLGMTETFAGVGRFLRDMRAAPKLAGSGPFIDGLTSLQVRNHAALSPDELIERLAIVGPRNARWRAGRRLMRLLPIKNDMRDGTVETWRAGYLFDIVLTRDTWMHRVDIARATGRPLELTADHDGRIVADVVAEWSRRHGQSFVLHLEGPAGGRYASGSGASPITLDAVEFCRILSGRAPGDGLLNQEVPF